MLHELNWQYPDMVVEVLETPQHTFNLFNRDQSTPLRSAKHLERAHSSLELVESLKLIVDIAKTNRILDIHNKCLMS
jgi:hypothetical protein